MLKDNMVFKGCFYKSNSASPELHNITLRLHEVEMKGDLHIRVIHVKVAQINELGIYCLSRVDFMKGVMDGKIPCRCCLCMLDH